MRAAISVLLLLGCDPAIPDGRLACTTTDECPPGFRCQDDICWSACLPLDCAQLRADCGSLDDGCGESIECGECTGGEVCGAGGIPNICACQPRSCELGVTCGVIDDGCGGVLDCGACLGGAACDSGSCVCSAGDCTGLCGAVPDGCGGILVCSDCPVGENCGGGGPNICGTAACTPTSCESGQCGMIADGCGEILDCGGCTEPEFCHAETFNVCGCAALTCAQLGFDCGDAVDPCTGTTLTCGDCVDPATCGGGGVPNVCGCPPRSCEGRCGLVSDACTGTEQDCGSCAGAQTCTLEGYCECPPDIAEDNDIAANAFALGTIVPTSMPSYTEYGIDSLLDEDWYVWSISAFPSGTTYTFRLTVGGIPAGADYDIELRPICLTSTEVVTCVSGAPLSGASGCRASGSGSSDEAIEMNVMGCTLAGVRARVQPIALDTSCSNYAMELRFDTGAA